MPMSGMEAQGFDLLQRRVSVIATLHNISHDKMGEHARADEAHLKGKAYAPERPNQRYVRTFTMKRDIRTSSPKRGEWWINNFLDHAVWVLKALWQTRYFVGRWWTVDDEVNVRMPSMADEISDDIEERWGRA